MSLDQHLPSSLDTLVSGLGGDLDALLKRFAQQLAEQAARERDAAVEAVRAEAEASRLSLEADIDQRIAEARDAVRADADAARQSYEADANERLAAAVAAARVDAEQAAQSAAAAAEEALQQRIDDAVALAASAQETRLAAALEEARAQARAAAGLEVAEHAARIGEREAALASVERLLHGIEAIDRAASLRETLDALADAVAAEAQRSMVLVVRGNSLSGWCLQGFGPSAPSASSIGVPLTDVSPWKLVLERMEVLQVRPDEFGDESTPLAFARLPRSEVGLAVPIVVGGRAVGIVYADDGDAPGKPVPGGWPEAVQVLARHASRCLEVLTIARVVGAAAAPPVTLDADAALPADEPRQGGTAGASVFAAGPDSAESARRYARLLISELKLYNEAAIQVGRHRRDLRSRLHTEIARARRMFDERIPPAFAGRDDVFEDELVRTLADGDPELLGVEPAERF